MGSEPKEKFALLRDFGIIEVLMDYDPETQVTTLMKFWEQKDEAFDRSSSSRVPRPGEKFQARAFRQVVGGVTNSEERLVFLKQQPGNIFLGVHGLGLVFEQKRHLLEKGRAYTSFDEFHRLPRNGFGPSLPYIMRDWGYGTLPHGWLFGLDPFEHAGSRARMLCFTQVE